MLARQAGQPGPQLVVVAHRDAAGRGARAELSGTAGLLELARALGGGRLRRTVTLASVSGGSGGAAGAARPPAPARRAGRRRHRARRPGRPHGAPPAAGRLGRRRRPELAGPAAHARGRAADRGRARGSGAERATTQWARLAAPFALGDQGPIADAGVPAVLVSLTGERHAAGRVTPCRPGGCRASAAGRCGRSTRSTRRPCPAPGTRWDLVTLRKVVPAWAVRLLVGSLLLAPLLVGIDGLARARRRRRAVRAVAGLGGRDRGRRPGDAALRPPARRDRPARGRPRPSPRRPASSRSTARPRPAWWRSRSPGRCSPSCCAPPSSRWPARGGARPTTGPGSRSSSRSAGTAAALWVVNPYAAALLVPAAHLWLLVAAPEAPLPRAARIALVGVALLPALALAAILAGVLGTGPGRPGLVGRPRAGRRPGRRPRPGCCGRWPRRAPRWPSCWRCARAPSRRTGPRRATGSACAGR